MKENLIEYTLEKLKNALSLIGKYKSGKKDISINHDEYLLKEFY